MTREKIIQGLYRGDSRAIKEAIKTLEQEPCEDAISRRSVLDYMKYLHGEMTEEEFVKALPSVTLTRKKGKWTKLSNIDPCVNCPICGKTFTFLLGGYNINFCPNCGAKMEAE